MGPQPLASEKTVGKSRCQRERTVGVKALPNGHAFVGSDIFPQLPSLYGILQNKGYFLYLYRASEYYVIYIHWAEKLAKKGKKGRPQQESSRAEP